MAVDFAKRQTFFSMFLKLQKQSFVFLHLAFVTASGL